MKKIFLIIGFITLTLEAFTQEKYVGIGLGGSLPFGVYAGLETDQSDYKDVGFAEYGYTMKFIDVQYRFYKNIGASYSWWKHSHSIDENAYTNEFIKVEQQNGNYYIDPETDNDYWSFSTHTVGFFLSTSSEPFDFNIKASAVIAPFVRSPEINVAWTDTSDILIPEGGSHNTQSKKSDPITGISLGLGGKYYISDRWAITGGIDYFALNPKIPKRRVKTTEDSGASYKNAIPEQKLKIRFLSVSFGIGYIW
ncbi:MAG: hypothetical protein CMD16_03435 [Flavobacteriales bacterium]|nr:hypothetical protein [Flavobacteriales bacterium]|tara:strand:- start:3680 stop:4435 length:756 start_codon:yes stop_codon:yes gene_type:complete